MTEDPSLDPNPPNERHSEPNMDIDIQQIRKSPTPDEDDEEIVTVIKKRIQAFFDSESDVDKDDEVAERLSISNLLDKEKSVSPPKSQNKKSRIKNIQNLDSDNEDSSEELIQKKIQYESVRNEIKRKKLKEKFKSLITSKTKDSEEMSQVNSGTTNNLEEDTYSDEIKQVST